MDEYEWIYENIIFEEINMKEDMIEEPIVGENIDCFNAFNTSHVSCVDMILYLVKVFAILEDVLQWACTIAYDIGFVTVTMRSDTSSRKRGMTL
ncbi:hypothetical protein GmHk_13G036642 [Glycine max]|nr:hypothetical protein GmHk_13G036642 [Glycine max]